MRKERLFAAVCLWAACGVSNGAGQSAGPGVAGLIEQSGHVCECGAHPPGPPRDRDRRALRRRAARI